MSIIANQPRQSNFELLRIVAMFLIVMHHYVVNSTILGQFVSGGGVIDNPMNYAFLKLIGAWGKTAINPFVMMSGFFMCTSELTKKRFLKIFLEWIFYSWSFFVLFAFCGYESVSLTSVVNRVLSIFKTVDVYFTASFMWFYLGIPIYNLVIKGLDKKGLYILTAALLMMFVIPITFFGNANVFHHVFWYMTLYFIGACIRLYPMEWMSRQKVVTPLMLGTAALAAIAILGRMINPCFVTKAMSVVCSVHESSTLLAFVLGTSIFLFFKNLNIGYHKWINTIASCMFGVLCIHAASNAMRTWLWQHICRVPEMANAPLPILALHAVGCVLAIMLICSLIDLARQKWIESSLLRRING